VINATPRPLYLRERPGTHYTRGCLDPRAGLDSAENLAHTRIRSPDRPARKESLYRLSYPDLAPPLVPKKRMRGPILPLPKSSRRDIKPKRKAQLWLYHQEFVLNFYSQDRQNKGLLSACVKLSLQRAVQKSLFCAG
jgi:hypothetical protein